MLPRRTRDRVADHRHHPGHLEAGWQGRPRSSVITPWPAGGAAGIYAMMVAPMLPIWVATFWRALRDSQHGDHKATR